MLALLRKEAREILAASVLMCALLSWLAILGRGDLVTPSDNGHLFVVAIFATVIGVCHGFGEFAFEERNTWRYLVHRSTGYRGAFLAKLALDWSVLALLTIVPLGVHAVWIVWFTDDASIALWSRYFEIVTTAAIGVGAHAIGVFASQLRRPTWLRFTIALGASIGFLAASTFVTLAPYESPIGPAARYLLWIAVISLPLQMFSYRMFVAGIDDDRAFAGRLGVAVAACTLVLLAPWICFIVGALQSVPVGNYTYERATIVELSNGELRLALYENGRPFEVPSHGSDERVPIGGVVRIIPLLGWTRWEAPTEAALLRDANALRPFEFGAAWTPLTHLPRLGVWSPSDNVWFPRRGGRIAVVQHGDDPSMRTLLLLGKGPEDAEFSALAGPIGRLGSHTICIVDLLDRTLWRLDPDVPQPQVERLELPDRDEFLRVDRMVLTDVAGPGVSLYDLDHSVVVVGKHGVYEWDSDHFVDGTRNSLWVPASEAGASARLRVELTRPDALEPAVAVRDAKSGALLFEYAYKSAFDVRIACAYACSIVRPTIGSFASLFSEVPANFREIYLFIDPLLTGGRRVWLLALNVVIAAALATRAWRRGVVGDPRRVFEALAILLLGVSAAVVLALVEPRRRAARKVVVANVQPEQLLISSV
jgi:hypothetical protein